MIKGKCDETYGNCKRTCGMCGKCKDKGGFQLVDLIVMELKDHMTCYKFECSHWWKIYL